MSKQSWPSIGHLTGISFDIPEQSSRIYVPFGKTRLNKMGLFYFRRHYWRRRKKWLGFLRLTASEENKWMKLPDGSKVFIDRV